VYASYIANAVLYIMPLTWNLKSLFCLRAHRVNCRGWLSTFSLIVTSANYRYRVQRSSITLTYIACIRKYGTLVSDLTVNIRT